ncbi:hypothetical protein [Desertivirga arenae]|uniref:hypothetical protein n=1 Tax=Desertivirga arenae TaxID=2810309 RepID=UPI001A9770CC|nr:hypothetical protein [Pedobacter sp. SYSU D00823]
MKVITLCYRKVIDSSSETLWEKMVFEDSYAEFRMQSQYFDQEKKYQHFGELIQNVPGAERLHFLVSASVTGYITQLNSLIPDVLDNQGRRFLKFHNYRFEIINSSMKDISKHQVAINFFSNKLVWHDTVADQLLISEEIQQDESFQTHLLKLIPFLSIDTLKV